MKNIDVIVFSKNRACQLDLLLRSLEKHHNDLFDKIHILCEATDPEFCNGYEKIINNRYDLQIYFIQETNFQENVKNLIKTCNPYICFFVDDNILYRKLRFSKELIEWHFHNLPLACFSLRLGENIKYGDLYNFIPIEPPFEYHCIRFANTTELTIHWDWSEQKQFGGFGYPFSVDGHIYMRDDLIRFIDYEFDTPNALEGRFNSQKLIPNHKLMACLTRSAVVNNPINLVGSSQNNAGKTWPHSLQELNYRFLHGERIRLEPLCHKDIICCHQEMEVQFA